MRTKKGSCTKDKEVVKLSVLKVALPSVAFLEDPNANEPSVGLFHPRQLLHTDSGSLLQLHSESSSNLSESSNENLSSPSQSSIALGSSPTPTTGLAARLTIELHTIYKTHVNSDI
jgi:hypothetical protein